MAQSALGHPGLDYCPPDEPEPDTGRGRLTPDASGARRACVEDTVRVTVPKRRRIRLSDLWTSRPSASCWASGTSRPSTSSRHSGPLWLVLQPLGMLAAVSIAFSKVTTVNTGGVPYIIFALVGLAVWTYVQMAITVAPQVLQAN